MERLLIRPLEAAEIIGVGRTTIYEMLSTGVLPSVRIGRSLRIPVDKLREWAEQQCSTAALNQESSNGQTDQQATSEDD